MKLLHTVLSFCLVSTSTVLAETISLVATAPVGGNGASQSLTIQSNQVATLLHVYDPSGMYCTLRILDNQTQFSPSTAVVIPTDATGPVRILLESSADLVNWNDALPGIYGTSATNRFFRVRAVKQ